MTPPGWHPDPAGAPGRLRWWDGERWTDHVRDPTPGPPPAPRSPGTALEATVLVVGAPQAATPGCRVFELTDGAGSRMGRMVETSRGTNDSAFGAAMSRSKGWQHATTRELRSARGYPELVLAWAPATPGAIVVTLPDRREVGRFLVAEAGWSVVGHDGRPWGGASSGGMAAADGSGLSTVTPQAGGWRAAVAGGPHLEPLRSLVIGAVLVSDIL